MIALTGDETGLIKVVDISTGTVFKYGEQDRRRAVVGMTYVGDSRFATVTTAGMLNFYQLTTENGSDRSNTAAPVSISDHSYFHLPFDAPAGLESERNPGRDSSLLLAYNVQGDVAVYSSTSILENNEIKEINPAVEFRVRSPLSASCLCPLGGVLFGGRENDVQLFDINSPNKAIWTARNVSQDSLHLRVPIWITALARQSSTIENVSALKFYTGTAYKHIRLYDTAASQKPVFSISLDSDYRVSSLCSASNVGDEWGLYVADTSGTISYWDMRAQRKISVLKGGAGSVRCIRTAQHYVSPSSIANTKKKENTFLDNSPSSAGVAAVGLDRYLRVYSASGSSSKIISKVYLKNRLNCCLLLDTAKPKCTREVVTGRPVVNDTDDDILEEFVDSDSEGSRDVLEENQDTFKDVENSCEEDVDAFDSGSNGDTEDTESSSEEVVQSSRADRKHKAVRSASTAIGKRTRR